MNDIEEIDSPMKVNIFKGLSENEIIVSKANEINLTKLYDDLPSSLSLCYQ